MNHVTAILLLSPFAATVLCLVLPSFLLRAAAITGPLVSLVCAILLHYAFRSGGEGFLVSMVIPWVPSLGLNLHMGIDAMSQPMVLLTAIVGFAAMLSVQNPEREREYYIHLSLVTGAALAAFCSRNLFFFYLFCETTTVPKYLLTAVWGRLPAGKYRTNTRFAAMQVTLYIAAGAMIVLMALSLLYFAGGREMDLDIMASLIAYGAPDAHVQKFIFGLMLLGFGIWSSMWPFHSWSPLTYAALPAPAAMLFAGVVKNFGVYALLRIGLDILPQGAAYFAQPLAVVAVINILYGGFVAMRQTDWNYTIAYSSISHMGYLLLVLAAAFSVPGGAAVNAVLFFMFAHGIVVALFFLLTGHLQDATGSRFVSDHGGLARTYPLLAIVFSIAVVAGSGLPGFANFVAEVMVFITTWSEGSFVFKVGAIAAAWGVVMTATYLFRASRSTFHGELTTNPPELSKNPMCSSVRLAILILVFTSCAFGVWPRLLTDLWPSNISKVEAP